MILRFKDPAGDCVNICFDLENYNYITEPGKQYITVSPEDLARIRAELDFNCFDYEKDLQRTQEQKEQDLREYYKKLEEEATPF